MSYQLQVEINMKIIIAGSRTLTVSHTFINEALDRYGLGLNGHSTNEIEIVSGNAVGIDKCGINYAKEWSCMLTVFAPDWFTYGKSAGPIRNKQMAEYADSLLLIWDGESKGSLSMKNEMLRLNKPIYEIILKNYNTRE